MDTLTAEQQPGTKRQTDSGSMMLGKILKSATKRLKISSEPIDRRQINHLIISLRN